MGKKKKNKKQDPVISSCKYLVNICSEILSDQEIGEKLFGTYSDGTTRNFADSLRGEFLSPKQKKYCEIMKKKQAKKKKKKKKNAKKKFKELSIFD